MRKTLLFVGPSANKAILENDRMDGSVICAVRDEDGATWYIQAATEPAGPFTAVHHPEPDEDTGRSPEPVVVVVDPSTCELMLTGVSHISVVDVSEEYGGPEEGGWWYTRSWTKVCVAAAEDRADAVEKSLKAIYEDLDEGRPLSSVLSRGQTQVIKRDWPVEDRNLSKPHYC